jgi:hypothetical protein
MSLIGTPELGRWVHQTRPGISVWKAIRKSTSRSPRDEEARYRESQYSSSICVSFSPTVGSAVSDIRTNPWSAASLPVPPLMGPAVVAVNAVEPGFCTAKVELWTKNLSPFSAIYT